MNLPSLLVLLNLVSTWYMVGLIWMVQVVHYPLFKSVGQSEFDSYQKSHQFLTTLVVGPPMIVELFSTVFLLIYPPTRDARTMTLLYVGLGLLIVTWLSTAFLQVPCHGKLEQGFDAQIHQRLVSSNWIRTLAWSARGLVIGAIVWGMLNSQKAA
ncbi:MAG: hypothetical protein AB8B55_11200 [Mariniblastus sp.]